MIDALHWLLRPYGYFLSRPEASWRAWLPGLGRVLVTGDPELLQQVMHHPQLSGGRAHNALRATMGDNHLIVMSGPEHRARAQAVRRALTAFAPDPEIARITRRELARAPVGQPFSMHRLAHDVSLRVILSGLLGAEPDELVSLSRRYQSSFSNPLLLFVPFLRRFSPWRRLLRRREELQRALLAHAAPADSIAGRLALEPAALEQELLALLMFGHETTAATFAWCFAVLPAAQAGRVAEDAAFAQAFVEETLRLYPPVAQLTRVADDELRLGPFSVPRGGVVMPAIPRAHRHFPDPDALQPARFLHGPPPRHYCPFGFGERLCPGKTMALRQLVVMLQTLLREFDVRRLEGYRPRPIRQLFLVVPHGGTPALKMR